MRNHLKRALAMLVALLVLCAPMAMADELPGSVNLTLALSDFQLQMGEDVNATVDVTAQLDLSADLNGGLVSGTLTALSGSAKAAKGGFTFDPNTMTLTAALEGATDAIQIPMAEMMEQFMANIADALPKDGADQLSNLFNAIINLETVAQNFDPTATVELMSAWMGEQITAAESGVSIEVDGMPITADRYDFEITAQELVTLAAGLFKTIQDDADLTAALQAYIDAVISLTGEEMDIDLANLDIDALLAEMPADEVMTMAGSLYVNGEQGHVVLDMELTRTEGDETTTVPYQLIMLNKGDTVYVGYYFEMEQYGDLVTMSVDVNATTDDKAVFDVTVTQTTTGDSSEERATFVLSVDCSDGADITAYFENSSSFTYNDQPYESLNAFSINYTGSVVSDENGVTLPGTLTFYVNSDGQEVTFAADTLAALTTVSNIDFTMPANLIDITKADGDTMEALGQEYTEVLYKGLMMLMGAPGMENLTSLFSITE